MPGTKTPKGCGELSLRIVWFIGVLIMIFSGGCTLYVFNSGASFSSSDVLLFGGVPFAFGLILLGGSEFLLRKFCYK